MAEDSYSVRACLTEGEIRALEMPFPGEISYSDRWRDYDHWRDARANGRAVLRRATEDRTRYDRPDDLEAPAGERLIRVLMLSREAEALTMPFPGDDDPTEYWDDFHARTSDRAVARVTLGRALEEHLRSVG